MNESEKQFSFTRAALSTCGRAKNQIPISDYGVMSYSLHVIGRELLARERARALPARLTA